MSFCGVRSELLNITSGIPQGTPLVCPLFNVYINHVVKHVKHCQINLFADDTILWTDAETVEVALEKLESDFHDVKRYLNMCKLKLSVDKTNHGRGLCLRDKSRRTYIEMCSVQEMKYLGVIDYKMSRMVGFMNRNKKKLPRTVRLTLYKCLIGSHIDYCSTVLFLNKQDELHTLQKIQNRALRIITYGDR